MEDSNMISKIENFNAQFIDKNEHLSWTDNGLLNVKENCLNNVIITDNDLEKNYINIFDWTNEQKFSIKMLENIDYDCNKNNRNISTDSHKTNDEEIKKNLKLKRKRDIAKEVRLRKKKYFENLKKDYNILSVKYNNLLNIINKCQKCNEQYKNFEKNNNKIIFHSHNDIMNEDQNLPNKKKLLFITAITIISLINIFNIPLNIINYYKSIENNKIDLRNLDYNYDHNFIIDKSKNLLLNKLNNSNGDNEALYIHFSEYYYLVKESEQKIKEKYELKNELKSELNKNIKIFKESEINSEQIDIEFAKNCVKCVVEIDKRSIKMEGDEFTFYFADRHLSKFFENKNEEGFFPNFNFEENKKMSETFSKVFAVKCKILAYCINDLFSEKIDNL